MSFLLSRNSPSVFKLLLSELNRREMDLWIEIQIPLKSVGNFSLTSKGEEFGMQVTVDVL